MSRFSAAAVALAALVPIAAPAQVRPLAPPVPAAYTHPRPVHVVFGVVASVGPTSLALRTRTSRTLVRVDDSAALRDGTYSAPLFVGKNVAVEGVFGPGGIFYAARVSRVTRIDQATGPDR